MKNFYDMLSPPKTIVLSNGHSVTKRASRMPLIFAAIIILIILSLQLTQFNISILIKRGNQFFVVLAQILRPDFSYAKYVWGPLFNTVQMSIMGSFIGSVLALPFSMICSSNINTNKIVLNICRLILSIMRTLPTLVLALIATLIFNLGTFAGTVAIAIYNFSMVGKMMYEYIETLDMGAYEAMEALGSTKTRAFLSAMMPQVMPIYLSTCLYSVETTVRNASVLGYVGAGGIGLILSERLSLREYHHVGTIILMLLGAVFIIETASRYCRNKLS